MKALRLYYFLLLQVCLAEKIWVQRNPRYLPFPMGLGNKLQIIAGFGIPVELKDESLTFGLIIKTNFQLPTNATQFTNPEEAFADFSKKKIRWSLYEAFISLFRRLSFGGKDCMLRSICESAFTPLSHNGVLGEILQFILSPSATKEDLITNNEDYYEAEKIGKKSSDKDHCFETFPDCSKSLLDMISIFTNTTLENSFFKEMF